MKEYFKYVQKGTRAYEATSKNEEVTVVDYNPTSDFEKCFQVCHYVDHKIVSNKVYSFNEYGLKVLI